MRKSTIIALVMCGVGIVGTVALADVAPAIAPTVRVYVGLILLSVFVLYFAPYIFLLLFVRMLKLIAKFERGIANYLITPDLNSHFVRSLLDKDYRIDTVYAVTAFVYRKKSKAIEFIWLQKHSTHHELLPPGGRLIINELPHEAIITRVEIETGIPKAFLKFSPVFHKVYESHLDGTPEMDGRRVVRAHPVPFVIQTEEVEQKGGTPYHYDFIYVIEANYTGPLKSSGKDQSPSWLSMDDLEKEVGRRSRVSGDNSLDDRFLNVRLLARNLAVMLASEEK